MTVPIKKLFIYLLWALFPTSILMAQDVPFQRGVNLTGWFQASSAKQIQFTRYTYQDFENIKSLGCDVVRLPINLHHMTKAHPTIPLIRYFMSFWIRW
jgi:endoglucanase